jgi:exonuclease SbcC
MMKELFNLEKYELYYKAAGLETKANEQRQNIEGQLQQIGDTSAEKIEQSEASYKQACKEVENLARDLTSKQEDEVQQGKVRDLLTKKKNFQLQQNSLKGKEAEIEALQQKIADYEYCTTKFQGLIRDYTNCESNITRIRTNIESDETKVKETSLKLTELEKTFEVTRKEFENREVLMQKADELSKISRIFELQAEQKTVEERIRQGEKFVTDLAQKLQMEIENHDKLTGDIKTLRAQYPDMAQLSHARDWHSVNKMLLKASKEIEADWNTLKKEIDNLNQQKALLFNTDCFVGIAVSESFDKVVTLLEEKKQTHANAIEILNRERQHLYVQQMLEQYASELEDGKPCPLCGSLSHPSKVDLQDVSEALQKITKELSHHNNSITAIDNGAKRFAEINTTQCLKEEAAGRILKRQQEHQQKQFEHQQFFRWPDYKEEEKINAAFVSAEKLQVQITQKETTLEKLRLNIETESKNRDKFSKAIEDLKNRSIQILTEANTLKNQLKLLRTEDYDNITSEVLQSKQKELIKQYQEVQERYKTSFNHINNLKQEKDTLNGRIEVNRKNLENEQQNLQKLKVGIDEQLQLSKFATLDEVKLILTWAPDLAKERQKVTNFRQELDFVNKQLDMLIAEIGDRDFSEEAYQGLLVVISALSQELKQKNQYLGELNAELKKLKGNLVIKLQLQEDLQKLLTRIENLKTLKQLFKGGGFVNYISSVYLQELCRSANDRFYKLSGQKLSIELTENNDFQVRDFMNGGKVRSVKTLSGGQTFQAALSLALTLSDNTRSIRGGDENFFFLDEGFGSLDKESLDIVFDTLKSLRRENRIIGIISHVEEMQQEIDIHLRVRNMAETGSIIEKSWEGD